MQGSNDAAAPHGPDNGGASPARLAEWCIDWRSASITCSDEVRELALTLPETTEKEAWSMPAFRVRGKMFPTLPDEETSMAVRCPKEERDELVLAEPEKFWVADHEASFAWVRVRLTALDDADELRAIVVDSWRQAAPPVLLQAHPELVPPA